MPGAMSILHRWINRTLVLAGLALLALHGSVTAQAGTVSGVVTDSASGRSLSDALIRVLGTDLSTHTNLRGQFTLSGLSGTTVTLSVTRIGYQPRTLPADDLSAMILPVFHSFRYSLTWPSPSSTSID